MNKIKYFWNWLFSSPDNYISSRDVFFWWESRRIAYNFIVGTVGLISFPIFFLSITSSGILGPGEDAVEPMALFFAPFAINICYCLGWISEISLRFIFPAKQQFSSSFLLKLGFGFSLFVVTFPAISWSIYRLLQH